MPFLWEIISMRRFFRRVSLEDGEDQQSLIQADDEETRPSRCKNPGMSTVAFVVVCVALTACFGFLWLEELVMLSSATPSERPPCPACAKNATGFELQRLCSEALYRCGRATLVFVHVHKGGGSTFVSLARANGAGLSPTSRNGDPTTWRNGPRDEWWKLDAKKQRNWFRERRRKGTRFVSTEKGFPTPDRLLPPVNVVYAIVVRDPVSRFLSYYFWRYRDTSLYGRASRYFFGPRRGGGSSPEEQRQEVVATVRKGAPKFGDFVESETPLDGYYVSRLLGKDRSDNITENDLQKAIDVLQTHFSLVLVTERLGQIGDPLVRAKLGWWTSTFDECRQKSNPKPDFSKLRKWRGADWHDELGRLMPLDISFYEEAWRISQRQFDDLTGAHRGENNSNISATVAKQNLVEVLP